jgi:hypothetical protein
MEIVNDDEDEGRRGEGSQWPFKKCIKIRKLGILIGQYFQ